MGRDRGMQDGSAPGLPEAGACFAIIVQGAAPWAGVVQGIDGVRDALVRTLQGNPERAVLGQVAAILEALDDPATWRVHGAGDDRPYWHLWFGYEGGSVTVQRLTAPLPAVADLGRVRAVLGEVAGMLSAQAADLRRLTGGDERRRWHPGPAED